MALRKGSEVVIYATQSFVADGHFGYAKTNILAGGVVAEFAGDDGVPECCQMMQEWGWPVAWQRIGGV